MKYSQNGPEERRESIASNKSSSNMSKTNGNNLYVTNIPSSWDEDKLKEEFGKFGLITSSKMDKNKYG